MDTGQSYAIRNQFVRFTRKKCITNRKRGEPNLTQGPLVRNNLFLKISV